jgi:agmatinase
MINTFMGLMESYDNADILILPIAYENTTSYGQGTINGPKEIINASYHLEPYDVELDKTTTEKVLTLDEINDNIYETVKEHINKFIISLGGEHSITPFIVKAYKEKYDNLSVLQLDAHADLLDNHEGDKNYHGCVMKRISELGCKFMQVGIRSSNVKRDNNIILASEKIDVQKILDNLTENVYITIDVDVFDPSLMPSTGTPEPGGLDWYKVINLLKVIFEHKNVVGCDVTELAPIKDLNHPNFTTAKLVQKMILFKQKP